MKIVVIIHGILGIIDYNVREDVGVRISIEWHSKLEYKYLNIFWRSELNYKLLRNKLNLT